MAYIRSHTTARMRGSKPVKRYEVIWREPQRDANGLPTGKLRARQETYPTRSAAEARRDELNNAKHTSTGTAALADMRKLATRTFAEYAQAWLTAQGLKVAQQRMKQSTYDAYAGYLRCYALKTFGDRAIGSITRADCESYLAALTPKAIATRRLAWQMLTAVLDYAVYDGALQANPAKAVDKRATPQTAPREHNPLSGAQVAAVAASAAERHPLDGLLWLFLCFTGLREAEAQGLEVRDVTLVTGPDGTVRGKVRVERTKKRKGRQWHTSTPKSKRSKRTVPLPPWLAARMADYLADTHGNSNDPTAPLWPRRQRGKYAPGCKRPAVLFDWAAPMDLDGWRKRVLQPALKANGLTARLHDTRHTFAALQLSAGVHFMQVSQWLGHASYTLTLNTYGDWVPDADGGVQNALPEPVAAQPETKVVSLFG